MDGHVGIRHSDTQTQEKVVFYLSIFRVCLCIRLSHIVYDMRQIFFIMIFMIIERTKSSFDGDCNKSNF